MDTKQSVRIWKGWRVVEVQFTNLGTIELTVYEIGQSPISDSDLREVSRNHLSESYFFDVLATIAFTKGERTHVDGLPEYCQCPDCLHARAESIASAVVRARENPKAKNNDGECES